MGEGLPVRPGISTPLAPVTLVTTPWAETEAARHATATEVEERILDVWEVVVTVSNRSRFGVGFVQVGLMSRSASRATNVE